MDWRPFASLRRPGYDILIVWDYREFTFNWRPFFRYDEICLVAWGEGVFVASTTVHEIEPRITARIAVNGTLTPLDDVYGMPASAWRVLRNTLSPGTWRRYLQRCCTSHACFEELLDNAPRRTMAGLCDELEALETHAIFHVDQMTDWDLAVVSADDAVFPASSQLRAWKGMAPTCLVEGGHWPDLQRVLDSFIVDKERGGAAVSRLPGVASRLMRAFDDVFGPGDIVGNVIEVSGRLITADLWAPRTDPRAKLMVWNAGDIAGQMPCDVAFEQCDPEVRMRRQPSSTAGFIFSACALETFNSPREFLRECERVLVPGGYLAIATELQAAVAHRSKIYLPSGFELLTARDTPCAILVGRRFE